MVKKKYSVVVVGVGVVGVEMLRVLRQRKFPVTQLKVLARSARNIIVNGEIYPVREIKPEEFRGYDIALFAGTEGEKGAAVTYAPEAVKQGAVVIDNGADFRMDPKVPLVVPEVNPQDVSPVRNWFKSKAKDISNGVKKHRPEGRGLASHSQSHKGIIANPNCSTIQMVVALWPIYKKVGLKRVIATTFQAASGAGKGAVEQLIEEVVAISNQKPFNVSVPVHVNVDNKILPQQLAFNVFPHIGAFGECDYTSEEWKLVKETHKIMHDDKIKISATTVRVPVRTGHSEAVYIETKEHIEPDAVRKLLGKSPGLKVMDAPKNNLYPLPKDAEGKDAVFVGRIRKDPFVKNGLWLWVVADNLRKGAATNAVQIAELVIELKK